jgi:CMP/dCMP kinase
VIAIDGPAASGKSSVAAAIADRADALMFDTGAVYRALTLAALRRGISPNDAEALGRLARELDITVVPPSANDGRQYDVRVDDEDVTWAVRDQAVDQSVSAVSAHAEVRRALLNLQRQIGRSGRVVMPGRDIGTVVMPDAELKVWLDASIDERARRRREELALRGIFLDTSELKSQMMERDRFDASRTEAPMEPAADALIVQTDGKSIEQVVNEILSAACAVDSVAGEERDE